MTEFHLVVFYQFEENYGAHTWDGEGECPQYWKMKGGSDEVVAVLTTAEVVEAGTAGIRALAHDLCTSEDNEYYRQYLIGYELVTVDTDLLVRVRDAIVEEREFWGNDEMGLVIGVSSTLGESEALVKLAMAKLDDPSTILPVEEEDSPWEEYDLAA